MGNASAGNGLWLGHELLAQTARLATGGHLGPAARGVAEKASSGRLHRLVACGHRFVLHSCCGIRSKTRSNLTDLARPDSRHYLETEAQDIPRALILAGANRNDVPQLLPIIDAIPPIRGRWGRPMAKLIVVQTHRGYGHNNYHKPPYPERVAAEIGRQDKPHGSGLSKNQWSNRAR
jgi:hypothetical protein